MCHKKWWFSPVYTVICIAILKYFCKSQINNQNADKKLKSIHALIFQLGKLHASLSFDVIINMGNVIAGPTV